ncbi:MAG TPA: sugar phosphate isomerase/epimerase family protein, partial [Tepidisphaeraceae bacterium]|nr:sugar phosphate isomerase/epimerase family protein [Tepidisphaeraceae bacterium]
MINRNTGNDSSRREFLGQSALAIGALAATAATSSRAADSPPAAERAAPRPRRNWKKAFYGGVAGKTSLEKFKILKDAGFDGVEINSPGPNKDEVISALKETGLLCEGVVDSVHWNTTLSDADPKRRAVAVEALKTALRDCKDFGGSSVLLVPAVVNKAVAYDDAYKRSQEEIRKAIPVAQETGVKIAIENVWNEFLLSPMEAARYVDEFQSPWVGWHFDIGNVINYGWPEQWIRILGKRIVKLHIKEFSRKKRNEEGLYKGFQVLLLEGDNDWPAIMKALDDVGYSAGWATAEVGGGDLEKMKDVSARL